MKTLRPKQLAQLLDPEIVPNKEQQDFISYNSGPLLVVAGAGAGKTKTMALRVAYLVANGIVKPNEILGLTFTRKATGELGKKISEYLGKLGHHYNMLPIAEGKRELSRKELESLNPSIYTYDAYSERLVREYGMFEGFDQDMRIINDIELYQKLKKFVHDLNLSEILGSKEEYWVIENLAKLKEAVEKFLLAPQDIIAESNSLINDIRALIPEKKLLNPPKYLRNFEIYHYSRNELSGLINKFNRKLAEDNVTTFSQQTTWAAQLVREVPEVGERERSRFKVVMLDEYQDTSYAHRVLLSYLFGRGASTAVTAVGDPMQSIYGWNGAAADNLVQFMTDFPNQDPSNPKHRVPATKLELTTSWRNPGEVLDLANHVSSSKELYLQGSKFVPELKPAPGKGAGTVALNYFSSQQKEVDWVVDTLESEYRKYCERCASRGVNNSETEIPEFSAAILVRKNVNALPYAEALARRGVPYEVVGQKTLLDYPEVADVISIADVVACSDTRAAMLRMLTRPIVGLGLADVQLITRLLKKSSPSYYTNGLMDKVKSVYRGHYEKSQDLCEVLQSIDESSGFSELGFSRLKLLSSRLNYLRKLLPSLTIVEFFNQIISVFGIREEILSKLDEFQNQFGLAQIDQFLVEADSYSQIKGATIVDFLDYLRFPLEYMQVSQSKSFDLDSGNCELSTARVQIMTIHKAKGLEWDTVAVVEADGYTYGLPAEKTERVTVNNWLKRPGAIPTQLIDRPLPRVAGLDDSAVNFPIDKPPVFSIQSFGDGEKVSIKTKRDLDGLISGFGNKLHDFSYKEIIRLFYVAITRARKRLLVSGTVEIGVPFPPFDELHEQYPQFVECWDAEQPAKKNPQKSFNADRYATQQEEERQPEADSRWFPSFVVEESQRGGARLVKDAMDSFSEYSSRVGEGDVRSSSEKAVSSAENSRFNDSAVPSDLWEQEVSALIEERQRRDRRDIEVVMPEELTTSDLVRLKRGPEKFARNLSRPVPYEPSDYARTRGTDFHTWVEIYFGGSPELDIDDPDGEAELYQVDVDVLRENFMNSPWARRAPFKVEQPFTLRVGTNNVKGKIDAVFKEEDGSWTILDWKTGEELKPGSEKMNAAQIQLAVYKLAWEQYCRQAGEPDPCVNAHFFYVATGNMVTPDLPTEDELSKLLRHTPDSYDVL